MLRKVVGAAGCVKLRAAFVLILAAGLFACADAPDNAAASAAQQLSIGGESGTELANLQILHVGNGADPQTVDPHRGEGVPVVGGRDDHEIRLLGQNVLGLGKNIEANTDCSAVSTRPRYPITQACLNRL